MARKLTKLRFGKSKKGRVLALQELARGYRPRKSELGTIVFLALPSPAEVDRARRQRRPIPRMVRTQLGSKRKSIAIHVSRGGAKKFVSNSDGAAYLRPSSFDLVRAAAGDAALKEPVEKIYEGRWYSLYRREGEKVPKWSGGRLPPWNAGVLPMLKGVGRVGISFDRIAEKIAYELQRILKRRGRVDHNLFVRWRCVTRDGAGEYREWFGVVKFQAGFRQQLQGDLLERFALLTVYASLAQQLSGAELVTVGSAGRVRRINPKGVPRSRWKSKGGQRWEKNEYSEVSIRNFEFDIDELRL